MSTAGRTPFGIGATALHHTLRRPMPQTLGTRIVRALTLLSLPLLGTAFGLQAQCSNPWPDVPGAPGVEGTVSDTLVFDPDGTGPIGERVLVAGTFAIAGGVFAENLAVYDPATRTWAPFGPGPYPRDLSLARAGNGDLYVAGNFTSIAGVPAARIARFDGSAWTALGSGLTATQGPRVVALPSGVYAIGNLTDAGGVPTSGIARWDGSAWASLGSTALGAASFRDLVELPNGDLVGAAGASSANSFFQGVLRFDGSSWTPLGTTSQPWALAVLPNGELFAAANSIVRWTGTTWAPVPGAPFTLVLELRSMPNGLLVAAGRRNSSAQSRVATWDGFVWTTLGDCNAEIDDLELLPSGELLAAGDFRAMDSTPAGGLVRWNGSGWTAPNPGLTGQVNRIAVRPDGSIFVGNSFGQSGQGLVARWNGFAWQPIGGGIETSSSQNLRMLQALSNGDLLLGGQNSGALGAPILQRWSGSTWSTLATATSGSVQTAAELPEGGFLVGGEFASIDGIAAQNVARYDGSAWSPLGSGIPNAVVQLRVAPSGELLALAPPAVFRWTGTHWAQLGLSQAGVRALAIGNDGSPLVAGSLAGPEVLRWDGISWVPLGSGPGGPVESLVVLPDGDVVAGPRIGSNDPPRPLQRWNGADWAPLGGAIDRSVLALSVALDGDLLLSGDFSIANGTPRGRFARVSTSCRAGVYPLSAGCFTFPLALDLRPEVLPWVGGTCRSRADGLLPGTPTLVLTGSSGTSLALGSLLPWPASSCQLLVLPETVGFAVPAATSLTLQFQVPDTPALVGVVVHQQVVALLLDASGSVTGVRSSNSLVYTVGSF